MRPPGTPSVKAASVAAEPEANATASLPCSSAATACSSVVRFGLPLRE